MSLISEENKRRFITEREKVPNARFQVIYKLLKQPCKRVLDIGCLNSEFLNMFPPDTKKHGMDLVERNFGPSINFKVGDVSEGLPYSDGYFSAVVAGEIIEHLFNPACFIKEVWRILDNNGQFVLTTPNLSYWRNGIQLLRGDNFFWVDYDLNQNGHVRYFSPKTITSVLKRNGFQVKKLFSVNDVQGHPVLNLIGKIFKIFSSKHNMNLVVYCIKQ